MATVTCQTCGAKPELPEWMKGWYSVDGKSWCPLHRHSVRAKPLTAMDALWQARDAYARISMQMELEVG